MIHNRELLEILLAAYGLVLSPVIGIQMLKWRVDGGIGTTANMLLYLGVGIVNGGASTGVIWVLPEGSWLKYWAMLIVLFYLGIYAYTRVDVNMD